MQIFLSELHAECASKNMGVPYTKELASMARQIAKRDNCSIHVSVHGSNKCIASVTKTDRVLVGGVKNRLVMLQPGCAYVSTLSGEYGNILLDVIAQ